MNLYRRTATIFKDDFSDGLYPNPHFHSIGRFRQSHLRNDSDLMVDLLMIYTTDYYRYRYNKLRFSLTIFQLLISLILLSPHI